MKLRLNNKIKIKNMDILQQISDQIDLGDPENVYELTARAIEQNISSGSAYGSQSYEYRNGAY